jgi:hypothetical protein
MRRLCLAVLLVGLSSCPDFDLDSRRFVCADQADCGPGWMCIDGTCERSPDASAGEICDNTVDDDGDLLVDCRDPDCGAAACDDHNDCTSDSCATDGRCLHDNLMNEAPCGNGCACLDGMPSERVCNNGDDDDGDGLVDCNDGDCPGCMGGTVCCPAGDCLPSCM